MTTDKKTLDDLFKERKDAEKTLSKNGAMILKSASEFIINFLLSEEEPQPYVFICQAVEQECSGFRPSDIRQAIDDLYLANRIRRCDNKFGEAYKFGW